MYTALTLIDFYFQNVEEEFFKSGHTNNWAVLVSKVVTFMFKSVCLIY